MLLRLGPDSSLWWGAIPCTVGCWEASVASISYKLVPTPQPRCDNPKRLQTLTALRWEKLFWNVAPFAILSLSQFSSVQFSSVTQSCPNLYDPMNCSRPGLPVYHQLPEFTQTHVHRVGDAIQSSHPLLSPSPPGLNPSQNHRLFQRVSSSHVVAKVLHFQL